jgi:hypothetical protein
MNRFSGSGNGLIGGMKSRVGLVLALAVAAWLALDVAVAQDQSRAENRAARRAARRKGATATDTQSAASLETDGQAKGDTTRATSNTIDRDAASDQSGEKHIQPPSTLLEVLEFARSSQPAVDEIKDYKAVFTKSELVRGRMVTHVMDMKFRAKPFSVYFRYRQGREAGRQAIYVEGKFGNNLVVKEASGLASMAGRVSLRLDDPIVTAENRHPVTSVGIPNLLKTALTVWDRESKVESANVDVKFYPNAKVGEVGCEAVQLTYQKPNPELKFQLVRLYVDRESRLPVKAQRYGWPRTPGEKPPLVEDYTYTNVKINQKLTDADFDPATYGF